jgi:alkane 1-monooxygenase
MTRSGRIKLFGYPLCLAVPLLVPLGVTAGSVWLAPVILFGALPVLSLIVGEDASLPLVGLRSSPKLVLYLHVLPRLYALVWVATLAWMLSYAAGAGLHTLELVGLTIGLGVSSAIAICTAHELLHKRSELDIAFARVMTSLSLYGHMLVEHLHHHATLGTPDYGATAERGTSTYRFALLDFGRALKTGWRVERTRLARGHLPWWRNKVLQDYALAASFTGVVGLLWGVTALVLFVGQALFAIFSFEVITYVHHYGLSRGDEEDIGPHHSWAHHCWITNCLTFNNTFHSDHHLRPSIPYFELHAMHGSPRLPASYFTMFFVALIPALWYRVIHPRLDSFEKARKERPGDLPQWLTAQQCL